MNILEARRRTLGANVYKKTVQGNPVSVRSLARMQPGLKVFGRSEQFTTTGAQLIPFELGTEIVSENGNSKCVPEKDGFYVELETSSTGISEDDIYFLGNYRSTIEDGYDEYENLPPGTYYGRISTPGYALYVVVWREGSNSIILNTTSSGTFTVQNGDKFRLFIRPMTLATSGVVQAIISKQNDSVMYEPYTGGKPSPSPDYPQEIENAGDDGSIQVDVLGKNIFDPNYFADHYEVQGVVCYLGYKVPAGSKWTCFTSKPEKEGAIRDVFFSNRIVFSSDSSGVSAQKSRTVVADSGMIYIAIRNGHLSNIVNGNYWVQIEPSESATDYSPFEAQSLIVQTPNGLPGIPVTSGGNYADENGQQWICDEIDFRRRKYVQWITPITLTGRNLQAAIPSEQYGTYVQTDRGNLLKYPSQKLVMSDQYIGVALDDRTTLAGGFKTYLDNTGRLVIRLPVGDNRSLEEIKVAVDEQKPHFLCALATSIETDLSPEQMSAYADLHTNRPTTVVSATDGAGLELTYKTKKSLEVN